MELVEDAADNADCEIGDHIFKAVTEGYSYDVAEICTITDIENSSGFWIKREIDTPYYRKYIPVYVFSF